MNDQVLDDGQAEDDLRDRLWAGDPGAFEEVCKRFTKPIEGYLYNMTFRHDVAEDLCQQTFLNLYQASVKRERPPKNLRAYCFKIARNVAYDYFSHKYSKRIEASTELSAEIEPSIDTTEAVRLTRFCEWLQTAISKLDKPDYELLQMYYREGLRCPEIASRIQRTERRVRQLLAEIYKRLKRQFDQDQP